MKKYAVLAALLASVAMPAVAADLPEMRVATGTKGNAYWNACESLRPSLAGYATVTCLETTGSEMNVHLLNSGEADIAFAQDDTLAVAKARGKSGGLTEIATVGTEYVHLVCNKNSGIEAASDLEDKSPRPKVLIGKPGSGAATTLANWIVEDEDYNNVEPVHAFASGAALLKLVNGDYDCALVVSALGSKSMMTINAASNGVLALVDIDDKDMNDSTGLDGTPVYAWEDIDNGVYPNLTPGWFSDAESVRMDAVLVGRDGWLDENADTFDKLSDVLLMNKSLLK